MTLVIIPARMGSTRLPGKPLLKIGDKTIIERCVGQAKKAGFVPIVATDSNEIQEVAGKICPAIITSEDCASGTDRVAEAAEHMDPEGKHKIIVNYQGDQPFMNPDHLRDFATRPLLDRSGYGSALCALDEVVVENDFKRRSVNRHIGLYKFTRNALRVFARLPQTVTEKRRSLEQCRIPFDLWQFVYYDSMPLEINTPEDLQFARSCLM